MRYAFLLDRKEYPIFIFKNPIYHNSFNELCFRGDIIHQQCRSQQKSWHLF